MNKLVVFVGFLLFTILSVAVGDSFRCGNQVVSTGDLKMEVLSKCGPPDDSEIVSYDTTGSVSKSTSKSKTFSATTKKVEKLYYNCGNGKFIRVLTLIDGKVVSIENDGYGTGPQKCN
ncbi:MAG: DUF2845 domain-containing protein [Deferribacterota bacterium]|nr:DUF2845 domain-containing protein [Deferribacterota bacterium]